MKKFLSILCLAAVLLAGCAGQKNETDKVATEKVLCLTEIVSTYGDTEFSFQVTYETDGVHVTPKELKDVYVFVYHADGSEHYSLRYNEEGVNTYREDYTYNSKGQLTERIDVDLEDNRTASRTVHSYNEQGQLIKTVYEDRAGIYGYDEYTYDANGFLTEECGYNRDGVLNERYVYVTDSEGKPMRATAFRLMTGDTLSEWGGYTYHYDSAGRLTGKVWELSPNYPMSLFSYYYTYDENGNVTKWEEVSRRTDEDHIESTYTYSYDEDGYFVSSTDEDGNTTTCVYTEIELPKALAETARQWSKDGVKNAHVQHPEE